MKEKTVKEIFWDMLPKKMAEAHVKPIDLATALNLSKSTISCWMHRKSFPEMDNIQKIADILNCTTDSLLGREIQMDSVDFDKVLIAAYHAADDGTKSAVRKLLDI